MIVFILACIGGAVVIVSALCVIAFLVTEWKWNHGRPQ